MSQPRYAALDVTSNFSFLEGGSHPEELVATAKALGLEAIAIADRNTLAGIARGHLAAKEVGMRFVVGARLDLQDAPSLLAYPTDRAAYGRLCRLLTIGQRRAEKGNCILSLEDIAPLSEGLIFIALPPDDLAFDDLAHSNQPPEPQSADILHFPVNTLSRHPGESRDQVTTGFTKNPMQGLPDRPVKPGDDTSSEGNFPSQLRRLKAALPAPLYLAARHTYSGQDRARIAALARLGEQCGTPIVASTGALYHAAHRRPLQDVLTSIREKCTVSEAGFRLRANAERHLKSPQEMARLFKGHADALHRSIEIAERCRFSLEELKYEYPDEPVPEGKTPQSHLADLTWAGAAWRFPDGVPDRIRVMLEEELKLIDQLSYAPYFLTVHDIVHFARSRGILCQGRGSAANSVVCYCLAITNVNPAEIDLLFERFISPERNEPPDIDVDFEHERREEVIQYIYARYGRERAGIAATVISFRGRSAIREVGKAMGLSEDTVTALSGTVWGLSNRGLPEQYVRQAGLDPEDPLLARTLELTQELIGFPRHLSQHVGGFVLTRGPLCETVPIGNGAMPDRTFIEWDKDDLDALGLMKVDVLGLGMLTCIRKCLSLLKTHYGRNLTLATVPRDDTATYNMLCRADSLGVFQVESRAQMNMLPRLKPRCFYDLVIEVAIVRPGPIQGDMVHPYLRRRSGDEAVEFPSPAPEHGPPDELRQVLGKTMGVPLFQEQAMRLAMVAAKFSAEEANELRRAMATFRRRGTIGRLEAKMVSRMTARGYPRDFAERCFNQIKGFGEYGFPESHAASFAHLVYVSSWLKCHYPAAFAAALLNAQPMGFYAPAQIVRCAKEHGVEARAPDINHSLWDCTLEPASQTSCALRIGLRQIDGLKEDDARMLVARRDNRAPETEPHLFAPPVSADMPPALPRTPHPYTDLHDLRRRSGLSRASLERLAGADAMRSLGLDRRQGLWAVRGLPEAAALPLFQHADAKEMGEEPEAKLPEMPLPEHVVSDYRTLRLSLKAHPMQFLRRYFAKRRTATCSDLKSARDGARIRVAGVVLVRQRPGSAQGVVFMTIEDETGVGNAVIWPKTFEAFRREVMGARLILIHGRIQRHEDIIHIVSERLEDRSDLLGLLSEGGLDANDLLANADEVRRPDPGSWRGAKLEKRKQQTSFDLPLAHADHVKHGGEGARETARSRQMEKNEPAGRAHPRWRPKHPRTERIIPKSRDFH